MDKVFCSYNELITWKNENILNYSSDISTINNFHDAIMREILKIACKRIKAVKGELPCRFAWFVMGSAGRSEQGLITDQDHGIIYEWNNEVNKDYFLCLGKEIADGMNQLGYPYCHGFVMSSNIKWCKSITEWNNQLSEWIEEENLETLRNLHIFLDARVIVGEIDFLKDIKQSVQKYIHKNTQLLVRLLENVQHFPKGLGPFGQFIFDIRSGNVKVIDMKKTIYMPYINCIRLLSIKNNIISTSTLQRMDLLMEDKQMMSQIVRNKHHFEQLLEIKIRLSKNSPYESRYYIDVKNLKREEKKMVKQMMKDVIKLYEFVERIIRKRG